MLDAGYWILDTQDKRRCKLVIEHHVSDRIQDKENYCPARPLFQIEKSEAA